MPIPKFRKTHFITCLTINKVIETKGLNTINMFPGFYMTFGLLNFSIQYYFNLFGVCFCIFFIYCINVLLYPLVL
jgi:hypothetical protein